MSAYKLNPGLYSAIVVARSTDIPDRNITYSVQLAIGKGEIRLDGIAPQAALRWSSIDPNINLIPFPLGTRVTVHIFPNGSGNDILIETCELPFIEEC